MIASPTRIRRRANGFTLIELLVVIAIITGSSLLLPAIQTGREKVTTIAEAAVSHGLVVITTRVADCLDDAEETVQALHRTIAEVGAEPDGTIDPAILQQYRTELRANRQWIADDLRAIKDIFPALGGADRRLAQDLRELLQQLGGEFERLGLLVEALLVESGD